MEFRNGEEQTLKRLYEQPGLARDLSNPPDMRPHYLSIVGHLPKDISQRLILDTVGWVSSWAKNIYYIQRPSSLHLTFVEITEPPSSLRGEIEKLKQYILTNSPRKICVKLTSAKIGASGINCHVESTNQHTEQFIANLKKQFPEFTIKDIKERSISLLRYLFNDARSKNMIRDYLTELKANGQAEYELPLDFQELILVRIDKVAQYFELLHTFPL